MSKEFEAYWTSLGRGYCGSVTGEQRAFTAGRALGRREMIEVVKSSCDKGCPPPNVALDCDSCITCIHQQIADAIEAIPEEVGEEVGHGA